MALPERPGNGGLIGRRLKGIDGPMLALAFVVVGSPLALGGVHAISQVVFSAVALLGLIALSIRLRARQKHLRVGLVGLAFITALLWTFIQWVPLPFALVEWLSPASAEARLSLATLLGTEMPSAAPLSLDGSRTAMGFILLSGYTATFLMAANLNDHLHRFRLVGSFVQWAGLAVCLVGVLHWVTGSTQIYGIYAASVDLSGQSFLTSFVNPNHAAALMLLACCVSFGLWVSSGDPRAATFHGLTTLVLSLAVAATGSRACLVLWVVGVAGVFGWAHFSRTNPEMKERTGRSALLLTLALGVGGFLAASPAFFSGLFESVEWQSALVGEDRSSRWAVGLAVAHEHLGVGTGQGAFGVAASQEMVSWQGGWVTFAHNMVLQAFADWGLVMSAVIGTFFLGGFIGTLRATSWRPELAGVAIGILFLCVQNLVDFSFYIPGVGFAAAASTGFFVGHAMRKSRDGRGLWSRPSFRWHHGVSVIMVGVFCLCALHGLGQSPAHWSEEARVSVQQERPGAVPLEIMLNEHPRDFHLFTLAAYVAEQALEEKTARKLLDRALVLAPHGPAPLRRRALFALKRGQSTEALVFLKALRAGGREGKRESVRLVLKHATLAGLADAFFESDEEAVRVAVELLRQKSQWETVEHLLAWGMGVFPRSSWIREELAALWVNRPDKADSLDRLSVQMLAQSTEGESPEHDRSLRRTGYIIQGYLFKRARRFREAWHMFKEAADLDPSRDTKPLLEGGVMLAELGEDVRLDELLDRLKDGLGEAPLRRGPYHLLRSRSAEAKGDTRLAINEMQRALLYLTRQISYVQRLATLYDSIGDKVSADNVRERLVQLDVSAQTVEKK